MLNFSLALILAVALSACNLPKPSKSESLVTGSATYLMQSVEGKFSSAQLIAGTSIPESKLLTVKACMKDLKRNDEIRNHVFRIKGDGVDEETTSDANGCIHWQERIKYNQSADAKFITLERTITAHGLQKGSRVLKLAVNPWEELVYDLDTQKEVPNLVSAKDGKLSLLGNLSSSKQIVPTDVRISFQEIKSNELLVNIQLAPMLQTTNASGQKELQKITQEEFEIRVHLISMSAAGKALLASSNWEKYHVADGNLVASPRLQIPQYAKWGQLQMGIELKSKNLEAKLRLKSFEGVFMLADYSQLKGNIFSRQLTESISQGAAFSIEKYLAGKIDPSQSPGFQSSKVTIEGLQFNEFRQENADSFDRKRRFQVKACLKSPLTQEEYRAQKLVVTKTNGEKEELSFTDSKGCAIWSESVAYNFFERECEKAMQVKIENSTLGISELIPIIVNPWSDNTKSYRDVRPQYTNSAQDRVAVCVKDNVKAELTIDNYEFDKKEYNYSIDEFMGLTVHKNSVLKVNVNINRPSLTSSSGFDTESNAPLGDYRVRYAVVDMTVKDFNKASGGVYTVGEKIFRVVGKGSIAHSLALSTSNIKSLGATNQLVLEITPVGAENNFKPVHFIGPITLQNNMEKGALEKYDGSVWEKLQATKKADDELIQKLNLQQSSKQSFAVENNLSLGKSSEFSVERWLTTGVADSKTITKFCTYWFHTFLRENIKDENFAVLKIGNKFTPHAISECVNKTYDNIQGYFDLQTRLIVKKPVLKEVLDGFQKTLTVGHQFQMSRAFNETLTHTFTVDGNFGFVPYKMLSDVFSSSGGIKYAYTYAIADQKGKQAQSILNNQSVLMVEQLRAKIATNEYERCVVIKPKHEIVMDDNSLLRKLRDLRLTEEQYEKNAKRGLMICEDKISTTPLEFVENYYSINFPNKEGQMTDGNASKFRPFFMSVRGSHDFAAFVSHMSGNMRIPSEFSAHLVIEEFINDRNKALFLKGLKAVPGQVILRNTPQ